MTDGGDRRPIIGRLLVAWRVVLLAAAMNFDLIGLGDLSRNTT